MTDTKLRVLILNGSRREKGNTALALGEMEKIFAREGVEYETVPVGRLAVRGCAACGSCAKTGRCAFDDIVNELAPGFEAAQGLVVGSPVYYGSVNGTLLSLLQRLFYSTRFDKSMKVGAAVVCARRSGCTAAFDEINRFFTISNMPVVSSRYWNNIHGGAPGEAARDEEGLQVMRLLAKNMVFLMRSIALGKHEAPLPAEDGPRVWTNFIR